jgi:tripartite-type tricarboxylate transporter receptor subunit TctC
MTQGISAGIRRAAAALALAALFGISSAGAQTVEEFYRGKRITILTSGSVGGGYDLYGRLLAKHMPKFIPGQPIIVVQNMRGAEGLKAANFLYNMAAQDGSVIGSLQRNNGLARFYDPDNQAIQYDATKFHWLGSAQQEVGLFIVRKEAGINSLEDLKKKEISVSSSAHTSPSSVYARMLNGLYGSKIKVVEGYEGSQASLLAVERGEVDGQISGGSSGAYRARIMPWVKKGDVKVLMQMTITADPTFPDAPTAIDVVSSPADKQLFEIAFAEQVMGRPFLLPPGVPPDRVKALRAAFDATMKDPEFLAEANAQNVEVDPVGGEQINTLLDHVYSAPPELRAHIRELAK